MMFGVTSMFSFLAAGYGMIKEQEVSKARINNYYVHSIKNKRLVVGYRIMKKGHLERIFSSSGVWISFVCERRRSDTRTTQITVDNNRSAHVIEIALAVVR
jgi:hypothetical protein